MNRHRVIRCGSCAALVVNGIACHEHGCPESHISLATGRPYRVDCKECGCEFEPEERGERFCSRGCAAAHYGMPCDED